MKKKIYSLFSNNKFYVFLLTCIVLLIGNVSLSLSKSVMGWDNFSVSLNLELNWVRTLFSSWRSYRGLGTPGDSEQVDLIRLFFLFLLRTFLSKNLVEQIYYLLLYQVGMISTYFLALEVFVRQTGEKKYVLEQKLSAVFAAIVYGFNFHVFDTFFLPIAMYPARYAFLPLVLLFALKILKKNGWNFSTGFGFILAVAAIMASYLTATVFITVLLVVFSLSLSLKRPFRIGVIVTVFILLNCVWLLQFAQYTKGNAVALTKSSSFVDINQSLLNKPLQDFSWQNIITYYPITLSQAALPFTDPQSQQSTTISKVLEEQKIDDLFMLLLPSILAVIGIVSLLISAIKKKDVSNLWITALVVGPIIVLRKDQFPFGFLYSFLSDNVPFFEVVFRFGGTKFFPILLLGSTLLAGIGLYEVLLLVARLVHKKIRYVLQASLTLLLAVVVMTPFLFFFKQGMFSELVLVDLPPAYQQIANTINASQKNGRVVHFPFDQFSYWNSYEWGYFGSSFFHLMLEKPLIDRTFEPASPANDSFLNGVQSVMLGADVSSPAQLQLKSKDLVRLLQLTGVSFVLKDESVGTNIQTKNLTAWGVFNSKSFYTVIDSLVRSKELTEVADELLSNTDSALTLYETEYERSPVEVLTSVINVDSQIENGFSSPLLKLNQDYIQSDQYAFVSFPFWQPKMEVEAIGNEYQLSAQVGFGQTEGTLVSDVMGSTSISDVFVTRDNQELAVYIQPRVFPLSQKFDQNIAEKFVFEKIVGDAVLQFGDQVFSVEKSAITQPTHISSIIHTADQEMVVYQFERQRDVSTSLIKLTDNPNCFDDKKDGYEYEFNSAPESIQLTTENGMTCLSAPLAVNEDTLSGAQRIFTTELTYSSELVPNQEEKSVFSEIEAQPNYSSIQVCIVDPVSGECLNRDTKLQSNETEITSQVWADRATLESSSSLLVVVPAVTGYENNVSISNVGFNSYTEVERVSFGEQPNESATKKIALSNGVLTLRVPQLTSTDSFDTNRLALTTAPSICKPSVGTGLHTIRSKDGIITAYSENCTQALYTVLPLKAGRSYLWLTNYLTQSGRQPKQIVEQDTVGIYNQLLDRYYRYPDLVDTFAWANLVIDPLDTKIAPAFMAYKLQVQNEGQGMYQVKQMAITPIPQSWRNLQFQTGDSLQQFDEFTISSISEVRPSLYQLEFEQALQTKNGSVLLNLNQAFNSGWKVYTSDNWLQLVLGRGQEIPVKEHIRVNGWSNGWIIATNDLPADQRVYIWYSPERLVVWGAVISALTGIIFLVLSIPAIRKKFVTIVQKYSGKRNKKLVKHRNVVHSTFLGKLVKKKSK